MRGFDPEFAGLRDYISKITERIWEGVATRWWMTGTHTGTGAWGPLSGATVLMLGITHSEIADGLIRSEWTVSDELAVLKQIALQRG